MEDLKLHIELHQDLASSQAAEPPLLVNKYALG
jgi:hypothetical protein